MLDLRSFLRPLAVFFPAALALVLMPAASAAAPTITSLSPASAIAGGPAFTLTVNGANFNGAAAPAVVDWNGSPLPTTVISTAKLTAAVPANLIANPGSAKVTVVAGGLTSAPATFTISAAPLTLPAPNPASLPSASVNQNYTGTIIASGGTGPKFYWWVNTLGISMPGLSVTLPDGLSATTTDNNVLTITGRPTSTGKVTFTALVQDSAGKNAGPVTYTISVGTTRVSLPPAGNLPTATAGQKYSAAINAIGGDITNYAWTVNGKAIPWSGSPVAISDGITAWNTGGYTLSIGGTPTAAGTVPMSVSVRDVAPNTTAGPVQYTIPVNPAPVYSVYGYISPTNGCGNNGSLPPIAVTINTTPAQTTSTDGSGFFRFQNVPNGSYTLTPSVAGASSIFYPATQKVVVNNGGVGSINFQASLGYTVRGTAHYNGSKVGQIYLALNSNQCGGNTLGTSINRASSGVFTIRGVPPGSYNLQAWMDDQGYGAQNASNPAGSVNNLLVPNPSANPAALTVGLSDPAPVTLTSAPSLQVEPFNQGALVQFNAPTDRNGVETASSYTLEWSISNKFTSIAGSRSFRATGANGNNIWIVNGLANSAVYYFRVQGVAASSTSQWSAPFGPVTIDPSTAGNTVSGKVTFAGAATGPLYVGFYDMNANRAYTTQVGSKAVPPTSPASYTVKVPNGSSYFFFGILDQNNNGLVDPGDIQNTNGNNASAVVINGPATENLDLTPFSAGSIATLSTNHSRQTNPSGTYDSYDLGFDVEEQVKLPVAVTLVSGPNVLAPMDAGLCQDCGSTRFDFWLGINNAVPKPGDAYGLLVTYGDGSFETKTVKVGAVLNAFATNMSPTGSGVSATPNFSWTDPANARNYVYKFQLRDQNYNTIWQIPGNSKSSFLSSAITSLAWGKDPTGGGNTPTVSSLNQGEQYQWQITAVDSNGNSTDTEVSFETKAGPLTLPAPNPSSLGPAIVNQPYYGAINVSGGVAPYNWTVRGLSDYLGWGTSGPSQGTLVINGTPTQTGKVTFTATVTDNIGISVSQTYTIQVSNSAPLSLPPANSTTALVGVPFSQSLSASGGPAGGSFKFSVNGTAVPTINMPLTIPNGDGLTATNSGGNTLFFGGTPSAVATVILNVSVKDSLNDSAGPVAYTVNVVNGPSGANNANIKGRYACLTQGFSDKDNSRWASVSSLTGDGSGKLAGIFDVSGTDFSSGPVSGTLAGSYAVGADNNGQATVTSTPGKTTHWALALTDATEPAQQFRMVEADDLGSSPSGQHATANCYLTNPASFAAGTFNGSSFAFNLGGEGGSGNLKAAVGRFSASGGNISSATLDMAKGGQSSPTSTPFTGSYTAPNATTGRMTMTLTASGTQVPMVVYLVDANRAFMLQTLTGEGVMAGNLRKQQQSAYSGAPPPLSGPFVMYSEGAEFGNPGSNSASAYFSEVFEGAGDGAGNMTIRASYKDNNGSYSANQDNGGPFPVTFDPTYAGRVSMSTGNGVAYLYLFNNNSAFEMSVNDYGSVASGWVEPQVKPAGAPFTDAAIKGAYLFGQMPQLNPGSNGNVGEFTLTTDGKVAGSITTAGPGDFTWDQSMNMSYAWDSAAYGSYLLSSGGDKGGASCIAINTTKSACIIDNEPAAPIILQQ